MEKMQVLNWKPRLSLFRFQKKKKKKKKRLFSRDHQSLVERKVVDKVVDKVVSSSSSFSRSDFFDARVNVRDDSLFLFVVVFSWGKKNVFFVFFFCVFFFGLFFVGKNNNGVGKREKKRVKKTKSLHSFFSKEGETTPHSLQTRIDTHTNHRLFQVRKSRQPLKKAALSNEKKKAPLRDDASRRRRPRRRLSSSRIVSRGGGPLRRQERRGRGEKKSFFGSSVFFLLLSLVFFVSSRR